MARLTGRPGSSVTLDGRPVAADRGIPRVPGLIGRSQWDSGLESSAITDCRILGAVVMLEFYGGETKLACVKQRDTFAGFGKKRKRPKAEDWLWELRGIPARNLTSDSDKLEGREACLWSSV